MIKTWVLFALLTNGPVAGLNYDSEKDCLVDAARYKRAVCIQVFIQKDKT